MALSEQPVSVNGVYRIEQPLRMAAGWGAGLIELKRSGSDGGSIP
ncbi:hypothetical protein AB5J52_47325 [Streptomyces sp. R39]|uniref:Uncharacterized protein n=1 Tax=Streptomyces sp. R39 TaxID=3238631 RepID=A0AB39R3E1_9ACTN